MTAIIISIIISYVVGMVSMHFSTRSMWKKRLRNELQKVNSLPGLCLDSQGSLERKTEIYRFINERHKQKHVDTYIEDRDIVHHDYEVIPALIRFAHEAGCKIEVRDTGRNVDLEQVEDFD